MTRPRVRADFNGLFREILCLSHSDTAENETGAVVRLHAGMVLTAFDKDTDDEGKRDDLIASGVVEQAPEWLQCNGSRWVLRIDELGVRHESDFDIAPPKA